MIIRRKALPRRAILKGMGVALGLPFLDAMVPAFAATTKAEAPVRLAWFYVPNGIDMRHWTPAEEGPLGQMQGILAPLEPLKQDLLVLSNLTANWGRPLLVGAGDHGRALAAYMTGVQVYRTAGADLKLGVSADQIAANAIGHLTKLPSLEIGLEETRQAGNCDNGYSCAYAYNVAWKTETQPLPPISDPRNLFERLFGDDIAEPPAAHARRLAMRQSILDQVLGDTHKLESNLGGTDRRKLDEYLTSVREIEQQVERSEKEGVVIDPGMEKPFGVPPEFPDYFRLMTDMMLVAFKADLTRTSTIMIGREGSTRAYPEIGIADGHHPLTHHMGNMQMLDKVRQINALHLKLFAEFLQKLKNTREGDSNLLDRSMIVYGSGLSDGNVHTHDQLPTLLAGRGGDFLNPGRHIIYQRETPVANLFATMIERVGVRPEHVGDSTGRLAGLSLS
ncbi:MAG: DUF1552 domain-containing protein [Candidatus Sulfopaludibacter sp.]|nr:DUF1552 domain-containing protein [Candidatus Sulfopaludibacter sp.]